MKRLFAYMGLTILFTRTIVFYFEFSGAIIIWVLFLILFGTGLFVSKFRDHRKLIVILSLVAIFSSFFSQFYTEFYYKPKAEKYLGQTVTIEAEICEQPSYYGNVYFYEINAIKVNGNEENIKMILSSPEELVCEYKDIITCDVILSECEYPYYKSINAFYMAKSDNFYLDYTVEPIDDKGIGYAVIQLREKLIHAVRTVIPGDEGELSSAIALGDKYSLNGDLREKFEDTGLSHIIVVSGMHLSVLVFIILEFLKALPHRLMGNIIRFSVVSLFVLIFMAITGFTASIVRAGITALLTGFGMVIWRKTDPLNSLGIAAVIQCINPYAVGDVGLLLSYSAVLGLLILFPVLHNYIIGKTDFYDRKTKYYSKKEFVFSEFVKFNSVKALIFIMDWFLLSFSAVVFVTPITILYFGTVTPVGIIMSGILSMPVDVLLICTLLCSVLWYIPLLSYVTAPLAFISFYIAKFTVNVVEWTAKLPFSQIYVNPIDFVIWFAITAIAAGIVMMVKNNRKSALKITAYSAVIFMLANMIAPVFANDSISISVYPSGNGTTVVAECGNQANIISCGGDSENASEVVDLLHKETKNINLLIVPSTRNSESRMADDILKQFDVNSVLLYYMSSTKEEIYTLANECNNYYEFYRDDEYIVNLNENLTDAVINVDNHTYQYIYNDTFSVLIIPAYGECGEIPEEYREADFVIMSEEPKNFDLISYENVYWCSSEAVPKNVYDVIKVENEVIEIYNQ